jgi:23S rRNA pseudouridine955/2504/2580 synthase
MKDARIIVVNAEDDGQRLDRWLKKRVPELPWALAQKLIRKGAIKVAGKKADTDTRLAEGQEIRLPQMEERVDRQPEKKKAPGRDDKKFLESLVIHDDGDIVAFNKPGDIASQGGGGVERHMDGLLELLADKKGRRPRLIHRLDRDTSGVLLCARSNEAVRRLGAAFHNRAARKIYWAILVPAPEDQDGTVNAPLAKAKGPHKDRMAIDQGPDGKTAITDFKVIERAGKKAAFAAFMPRTGRTHQIRVHAADALNCPILGDGKYGGAKARIEGMELAKRLHLHARRLTLPNPSGKGVLSFAAPLPPELEASWDALGFDPALGDALADDDWMA